MQFVRFRPVQRCAVDGVEQVVEQVALGAVEAGESDHAVGREVRAVGGDGVEECGASRAGRAGEAYGTAAGQQPHQPLALAVALQERQFGLRGPGRYGWPGGAGDLGALGRRELDGPAGPFAGRADLYLAAVDRVDREQVVARDELHRAGERGCVLAEVGCEGVARRALTRRRAVGVVAVLLGALVVRVHKVQAPQKRRVVTRPRPLPALPHTALSLLVRARVGCQAAGDRTLNLRTVSTTGRGTAPSETSQSREYCA